MYTFILVLQVLACLILIASVLLQPAKEGGFALSGGGGASTQNVGQANPLFKVSMYCGIFLLATSLLLSWFKIQEKQSSVINSTLPLPEATTMPQTESAPAAEAPAANSESEAPKGE